MMMPYGYDSMMSGGDGSMMWLWMLLLPALVIAGLVTLIVVIVRLARTGHSQALNPNNQSARHILDERYARGEIDHEQYRQRREAMT